MVHRPLLMSAALLLLVAVPREAKTGWIPGWAATDLRLTSPDGGAFIVTVNEVRDRIPLTEVGFGQEQLHRGDPRKAWLDQISFMVTMQPPNAVIRDAAMNQDVCQLAFGTITQERRNNDQVRWPPDLTIAIVTNKGDTLPAATIDVMVGTTTHTIWYLKKNVWLGGQALQLFPGGKTFWISQALTNGSCRYVAQFPRLEKKGVRVKRYVWYRVHGVPDEIVKRTVSASGTGATTK